MNDNLSIFEILPVKRLGCLKSKGLKWTYEIRAETLHLAILMRIEMSNSVKRRWRSHRRVPQHAFDGKRRVGGTNCVKRLGRKLRVLPHNTPKDRTKPVSPCLLNILVE